MILELSVNPAIYRERYSWYVGDIPAPSMGGKRTVTHIMHLLNSYQNHLPTHEAKLFLKLESYMTYLLVYDMTYMIWIELMFMTLTLDILCID